MEEISCDRLLLVEAWRCLMMLSTALRPILFLVLWNLILIRQIQTGGTFHFFAKEKECLVEQKVGSRHVRFYVRRFTLIVSTEKYSYSG